LGKKGERKNGGWVQRERVVCFVFFLFFLKAYQATFSFIAFTKLWAL